MNESVSQPLSISELTRRIRAHLEDQFGTVWVEGEISNLRRQPSGHIYFTLKDQGAQLGAVFFAGSQRGLSFQPTEGRQVRVRGQLSVYEPRGQYQLIVRELIPAGQGPLLEAFEQLKRKLEAEGLFSGEKKKKLPLLPVRIGLITSPTGAALRDMLQVLGRRYPRREILLAPTLVQGEKAAAQIKVALEWLDRHGCVDVIIIGRGGGSLEDLWCFNDESLARAIYACHTPVMSAVGHETDFTICDFVADQRAPTPSAAAELVIRPYADWISQFAEYERRLRRAADRWRFEGRRRWQATAQHHVFREPAHWVRRTRQRLDELRLRQEHALEQRRLQLRERVAAVAHCHVFQAPAILSERLRARLSERVNRSALVLERRAAEARRRCDQLCLRAEHHRKGWLERLRREHIYCVQRLTALSPYAVLGRGYSMTFDANGRVLRSANQLRAGDDIRTQFAMGCVCSRIEHIEPETVPQPEK